MQPKNRGREIGGLETSSVFKPVAANGWHETLVHTARDGHQELASAYASANSPAGNSASDETHALWRRSAGLSNPPDLPGSAAAPTDAARVNRASR